jgi:hypothetical protein
LVADGATPGHIHVLVFFIGRTGGRLEELSWAGSGAVSGFSDTRWQSVAFREVEKRAAAEAAIESGAEAPQTIKKAPRIRRRL